jgi:hypothetical protein
MPGKATVPPQLIVEAQRSEIEAFLKATLTPEQLQQISIRESPPSGNPLLRRRGLDPASMPSLVEFARDAFIAGVIYDLIRQVTQELTQKFGKQRVQTVEPDSKSKD